MLALLVTASGCEIRVDVAVEASVDGSGEVRVAVGLDPEASERVPDLGDQLRIDDLREAGWTVTGPAPEADGYTWIRASKEFTDPADAGVVMDEISGPEGPFRDFSLRREQSAYEERIRFEGTVDLTGGLDGFGDDELRDRVDADLDQVADQIREDLDESLREVFRFRVAALLPGAVESNAPTELSGGALWTPELGEQVELRAEGQAVRWSAVVLTGVAAAAGVALVWLAVRAWRRPDGGSRKRLPASES